MKKKLLGILLVIALLMTNVSAFASGLGNDFGFFSIPTDDTTGTVTVKNLVEGETFSAYKLVNIAFNADEDLADQQLPAGAYTWASEGIETWVKSTFGADATIASVYATDASTQRFIQAVAAAVAAGTLNLGDAVKTSLAADANGTATLALPMGAYFLTVASGDRVYRPMSATVQPEYTRLDGQQTEQWNLTAPVVEAKYSEVDIDKKINEDTTPLDHNPDLYDTVAIGDTVQFDIRADIPVYPVNAIDETYVITDTMSAGLDLADQSEPTMIKVYGVNGQREDELTAGTHYTQALDNSDRTITWTFTYDQLRQDGGETLQYTSIHIVYYAVVNQNAEIGLPSTDDQGNPVNNNRNYVQLTYSNNPYVLNSHKTPDDFVKFYTFAFELFKYEMDGETKSALAGATFKLIDGNNNDMYFVLVGDTYYPSTSTATGATINLVSPEDGMIKIDGLDEGKYTLKETAAPEGGYSLMAGDIEFTFTEGSDQPAEITGLSSTNNAVALKTDSENGNAVIAGYLVTEVLNSKGPTLPSTGGMGTTIFTIVGIALMAGVVVLLLVMNKKKATKAN